jgi:hypothetical protein
MQFALAQGRFVAATGFAISEDGALATPLGIDDEVAGGARLLLSLAWTDDAVMPAKAGIHRRPGSQDELRGNRWTPAFAGVTGSCPDLSELSGLVSPVLDRIVGRT